MKKKALHFVDFPEELKTELRVEALRQGLTLKQLAIQFFEKQLIEEKKERVEV